MAPGEENAAGRAIVVSLTPGDPSRPRPATGIGINRARETADIPRGDLPATVRTMPDPAPTTPSAPRSLARLAMPFAAAGMVVACLAVLLNGSRDPGVSESQVHREIREIALHRGGEGSQDDGGHVGPWWISASDVDPLTGIFRDFKLTSGKLRLASTSALLIVDADTDMVSIHLEDVVMVRVLDGTEDEPQRRLHHIDVFDLGPIRWHEDIVRDGGDGIVAPAAIP
jgi:hypothetical protein